jgi:hypothetical protein
VRFVLSILPAVYVLAGGRLVLFYSLRFAFHQKNV